MTDCPLCSEAGVPCADADCLCSGQPRCRTEGCDIEGQHLSTAPVI